MISAVDKRKSVSRKVDLESLRFQWGLYGESREWERKAVVKLYHRARADRRTTTGMSWYHFTGLRRKRKPARMILSTVIGFPGSEFYAGGTAVSSGHQVTRNAGRSTPTNRTRHALISGVSYNYISCCSEILTRQLGYFNAKRDN